jgi:hypothetical protein
MTASITGLYCISVPETALMLPPPGNEVDVVLEAIIASLALPPASGVRLRGSLAAAAAFAHARPNPGRAHWALVEHPKTGNVDAVLSLDIYALKDDDGPENYEARMRAAADSLGDAISYNVSRLSVADRPAVLTYQLELPAGAAGIPAVEQATLAHFTDEHTMLEYRMVAQDLAAYDDISAYVIQLASGMTIMEADGA